MDTPYVFGQNYPPLGLEESHINAGTRRISPYPRCGLFYIFIRCLYLQTRESVIEPLTRELEQLATLSVKSLVRTVYHLSVTDPNSRTLAGLCQCYNEFLPAETNFKRLSSGHMMAMAHVLFTERLSPSLTEWVNEEVPSQERIPFAWYVYDRGCPGGISTGVARNEGTPLDPSFRAPISVPRPPTPKTRCSQLLEDRRNGPRMPRSEYQDSR